MTQQAEATASADELYQQREQRIRDAIALKEPDRLPTVLFSHFWVARYAGMTCREAMYDYDGLRAAMIKAVGDLEPDGYCPTHPMLALGRTLEILDYKQLEWPGKEGVPEDVSYQYLDREYVKAPEFDEFLQDPTGFYLHKYLPRAAGALEALENLPQYPSVFHTRIPQSMATYANPEVRKALMTMIEAGEETQKMYASHTATIDDLTARGFPCVTHATSHAPFDVVADYLRGSKGAMLDMFRKKDKLLEVLDRITEMIPNNAIAGAKKSGGDMIFIPLHWGLDGFMSPEQFETFYWPQFRRVLMTLNEAGLIPHVLWEGDCTSRLDVIKDVPPGSCVYFFERTDMFKAKEILGDTVCIRGNVPASMLMTGTPEEVREYAKKLFNVCGDGGGFILDGGIGIPDEAKPENVQAMFDVAKECVY